MYALNWATDFVWGDSLFDVIKPGESDNPIQGQ